MTADEAELADMVDSAIIEYDRERPRSKQTREFRVGMSELGFCSERTRRMLAGITPEPTDNLAAFIGTAIGDYVERAVFKAYPGVLRQVEVTTVLATDQRTYTLTGHPDLVFPWGVVDVKTVNGLEAVRRTGPSTQQQYQRHGYALGAHAAGFLTRPLHEVKVANVWFDRSAEDNKCHVQMETFDPEILSEAGRWLDDVVYAYLNDEPAQKEPPRNMCEVACGHFSTCRLFDTDVEGLITDEPTLTAIDMYREGLELEAEGARLKKEARPMLKGVSGSDGTWMVRWVHVEGGTVIPARTTKSYERLNFSRLKKEQQ
jgi:hypothetical protein